MICHPTSGQKFSALFTTLPISIFSTSFSITCPGASRKFSDQIPVLSGRPGIISFPQKEIKADIESEIRIQAKKSNRNLKLKIPQIIHSHQILGSASASARFSAKFYIDYLALPLVPGEAFNPTAFSSLAKECLLNLHLHKYMYPLYRFQRSAIACSSTNSLSTVFSNNYTLLHFWLFLIFRSSWHLLSRECIQRNCVRFFQKLIQRNHLYPCIF